MQGIVVQNISHIGVKVDQDPAAGILGGDDVMQFDQGLLGGQFRRVESQGPPQVGVGIGIHGEDGKSAHNKTVDQIGSHCRLAGSPLAGNGNFQPYPPLLAPLKTIIFR